MSSTATLFIALCMFFVLSCLIAVLSFRNSQDAVRIVNDSHSRNQEYTKDLLDRLMAMDFNTYKAYTAEVRRDGEEVEEYRLPAELPVIGSDRGGFGSGLGLRAMIAKEVDDENSGGS